MAKKFTELKLNELQSVTGGVATAGMGVMLVAAPTSTSFKWTMPVIR